VMIIRLLVRPGCLRCSILLFSLYTHVFGARTVICWLKQHSCTFHRCSRAIQRRRSPAPPLPPTSGQRLDLLHYKHPVNGFDARLVMIIRLLVRL
jgi:hypothetical protein